MYTAGAMRGSIRLALCLQLLALACGDDDSCPAEDLDEFCDSDCVAGSDAAIARICSRFSRQWFEAKNDCGGRTIQPDANFTGAIYHFDAKDKLVGVTTWTDVAEDECGFTTVYGRGCEPGKFTAHDCSPPESGAVEP